MFGEVSFCLLLAFPFLDIVLSPLTNTHPRTIINEAAAASPKQPIINMGQGFFGYNPPEFILNAAKDALNRVECNQYSPTKGRPRLKKAISEAYAPHWGRKLDPETEITITTGANEGLHHPDLGRMLGVFC
jgi:aspartate/methionine/tyrosine aminotransferase